MKFTAESRLRFDQRTSNIEILIDDSASRGNLLTLVFTPEQFAKLIANQIVSDIEADINPAVKNVGRQKVVTIAVIRILGGANFYDQEVIQAYIQGLGHIHGWTLSTYLGSQNSLTSEGNDLIVRIKAFKFLSRGVKDSQQPPTLNTTVRIQDVKSKAAQAKGR